MPCEPKLASPHHHSMRISLAGAEGVAATIAARSEGELRAAPVESALRLAFLHSILPASRLGAGQGRVPGIRILRSSSAVVLLGHDPYIFVYLSLNFNSDKTVSRKSGSAV